MCVTRHCIRKQSYRFSQVVEDVNDLGPLCATWETRVRKELRSNMVCSTAPSHLLCRSSLCQQQHGYIVACKGHFIVTNRLLNVYVRSPYSFQGRPHTSVLSLAPFKKLTLSKSESMTSPKQKIRALGRRFNDAKRSYEGNLLRTDSVARFDMPSAKGDATLKTTTTRVLSTSE